MDKQSDQNERRALLQNALTALDKMQRRVNALEQAQHEPIAIIGLGCRFPGDANTPEAFWQLLRSGVDTITEVPVERWDLGEIYDPDPDAPGKSYTRWGAFLQDVDQFDASFFGVAPREAMSMDPQHRLLLEVAWTALEHAGLAADELMGSKTGVFVGLTTNDYLLHQAKSDDLKLIDAYLGAGAAHSVAAGRLSYTLGLHGPNLAVDTACSSSLVATHLAVQSLRNGESDMALAGGVNLTLLPDGSITTSRSRMMSFDGRCKTFDASADGYVRGEGCAIVVLKRLSDAQKDGDNVLAVILGTALNQDGRSNGLTAPNGKAQEAVIRAALANARVEPEQIGYVETHGTGTTLGDPIEVQALGQVFGTTHSKEKPLHIGSVKTNVGHLEGAAGIVGLCKVVLALQNKTIPPHLHLQQPNPYIPWAQIPVDVPNTPTFWDVPSGGRRIGGLSSFGFSGTNGHMIIAEAPSVEVEPVLERPSHLITLSAKNEHSLAELAAQTAHYLEAHPDVPLGDVAYTSNIGRSHFDERLAILASDSAEAASKLANWQTSPQGVVRGTKAKGEPPTVAFLFTGQGAQYAGMGQHLYQTEPLFRAALDKCEEILRPYLDMPLLQLLYGENGDLISQTQYTQPALFALEYALAQLWLAWGIQPAAVMGHSVGEYVAACIAGVFSLEDGLKLIAARGRLMGNLPAGGAMAAIFADEAQVNEVIAPFRNEVAVAAVNGPNNIVISGEGTAVSNIVAQLAHQGIKAQPLTVSHAFHSPLMEPMLDEFARVAATIQYASPQIELISNVTGKVAGVEVTTPAYWRDHVRAAVRFADGLRTLHERGYAVFLECGPQPTLLAMGRRCLPDVAALWQPSLRPGQQDWGQMLQALAQLYAHGVDVKWRGVQGGYGRRLHLPVYPFNRQRYWLERPSRPSYRPDASTIHPLLHERLQSPLLTETVFAAHLSTAVPPYLTDHRIFDVPLFPATGFLEVALAAAEQALGTQAIALTQVQILEAMPLPAEGERVLQAAVSPLHNDQAAVRIFSREGEGDWQQHVTAVVTLSPALMPTADSMQEMQVRCEETVTAAAYYQQLEALGVNYGPAFRGIQQIWRRDWEALGHIALPATVGTAEYRLHPALLDACFQLIGAALPAPEDGEAHVYVPIGLAQFQVAPSAAGWRGVYAHARLEVGQQESLRGTIQVLDEAGQSIAWVDGIQFRRVDRLALQQLVQRPLQQLLYQPGWQPAPAAVTDRKDMSGRWLILADGSGLGEGLAARLEAAGGMCTAVSSTNFDLLSPAAYEALVGSDEWRGVVHLWALEAEEGDIARSQQIVYGSALLLTQALLKQPHRPEGLWFVTQGAQVVGGETAVSPAQSALWGFASTLAAEQPDFHPVILDVDDGDAATALWSELQAEDGEERVAWRGQERWTARLLPYQETAALKIPAAQPFELALSQQGTLDNIIVRPKARRQPEAGEVEVAVQATGLNFRDVLNVLGMYPGPAGALGNECAGVVTAVGSAVSRLQVGDRVVALGAGTFASHIVTPANYVFALPDNLSFTEAATMPITFLTAYYGLHHLAKIQPGERVLIHAAAGGVGMAAVQLALQAGAELFGTASSPEKRAFLQEMGVKHVFNSRTLDFSEEIMAVTNGGGVHIVLNALADEFIDKSMAVLADNGRFLEIGKRGIWTSQQVAELNPTLAYYPYDLAEVLRDTPEVVAEMMVVLMQGFAVGDLRPLPQHTFAMSQTIAAFRYMAQARHIGKVVVVPDDGVAALVRHEATYLITGGLGGLGLAVAQGLVARGARHLVLMGRRGADTAVQSHLDALTAQGVQVMVAQGDVAQPRDVQRVLHQIAETMPSLRGVVHAAGVLDDGVVGQQSWSRYETVMQPKVCGAWHLHEQTQAQPLDFFVLFSAGAALLGSPGQINYAAANAFMDGLAHARQAQGLPALSINWGAWSDVGMAAGLDGRIVAQWQASGMGLLSPEVGVTAMFHLLGQPAAQAAVLPIDWGRLAKQVGERPYLQQLLPSAQPKMVSDSAATFLARLAAVPAQEQFEALLGYVQEQVVQVLGLNPTRPPDERQGLTDLGMDSLMAVELSNRLQAGVGQPLPSTLAFEQPTIEALAMYLANEVIGLQTADTGSETIEMDDEADVLLAEIEELTDSEAEDSLLKELEEAGY